MSDAWRNARAIEELREEVKDLRRLILKTVEYMKDKKTPSAPMKAKTEPEKKKKTAWF